MLSTGDRRDDDAIGEAFTSPRMARATSAPSPPASTGGFTSTPFPVDCSSPPTPSGRAQSAGSVGL